MSDLMPDRDRAQVAVEVLLQQAVELQPAIGEVLERAVEATRELTLLLQKEEALREAERALTGRKGYLTSASSLASSRWKRSERASRSLRDLEQLARAANDHSRNLRQVARRKSPSAKTTQPPVDLLSVARSVSLASGRVRVQEVADEMQRHDPERYSSARSAYAAIYDQLRRSPDFERVGPGEFVLVSDGHQPLPGTSRRSMAAGRYAGPSTGDSPDLPFEIVEPPKRLPTQQVEDLPFE